MKSLSARNKNRMKKKFAELIFKIVRHLHKKSEAQLIEAKRNKLHGSPEYVKIAKQERKLREMKKAMKSRTENSK